MKNKIQTIKVLIKDISNINNVIDRKDCDIEKCNVS